MAYNFAYLDSKTYSRRDGRCGCVNTNRGRFPSIPEGPSCGSCGSPDSPSLRLLGVEQLQSRTNYLLHGVERSRQDFVRSDLVRIFDEGGL